MAVLPSYPPPRIHVLKCCCNDTETLSLSTSVFSLALFAAAAVPIRMSTTQERVRKKGGVQTIEKEKVA